MDNITLNKLPKIQASIKKEVPFRGGSSSTDFNEFQENIFFDLSNMFNLINDYDALLQQTSELQAVESTYGQIRISKLATQIELLRNELDSYRNPDTKFLKVFLRNMSNAAYDTNGADINKLYDQINVPKHTVTSKLYLLDVVSNLITIPDTLKVVTTPVADGVTIIDNDFRKAFNGKKNEYFLRKIINNDISEAELTVELTLPDNIISNRDVNTIELSPFPYSSVDVMALEYQLNGNWITVPGFTSHRSYKTMIIQDAMGLDVEVGYIEDAENIKLCFKKTPMSKIRIKLKQKTYVNENGTKIFYIGLRSFEVNYEIVNSDSANFSSTVEFRYDGIAKILSGIVPHFNNAAILSDKSFDKKSLISYEIYSVTDQGVKEYIKNSFPVSLDQGKYAIVAKLHYDKVADVNPSLYSLDLLYNNTVL